MKHEAFLLVGICSLSLLADENNVSLKLPKPEVPAQFIKGYNNAFESPALDKAINAFNFAASLSIVFIVSDGKKKSAEIHQASKSSLDIISE